MGEHALGIHNVLVHVGHVVERVVVVPNGCSVVERDIAAQSEASPDAEETGHVKLEAEAVEVRKRGGDLAVVHGRDVDERCPVVGAQTDCDILAEGEVVDDDGADKERVVELGILEDDLLSLRQRNDFDGSSRTHDG